MAKIIVTGTPGSGKSTVLAKLSGIEIVTFSSELLKLLAERGITDRDQVRRVPYPVTVEIRRKAIEKLNSMNGDMLIDTHASVKKGIRYIPGFSTADLGVMEDVKGIIYIDAHANDILLRRILDKTRKRDADSEEEIKEQRRINAALVASYALYLDVPMYIIMNRQDMIEKAVEDTKKAINDALGKGEFMFE
jgi:adenylate kinase